MPRPSDQEADSLRLYSRPGCHLCEKLIEELLPLIRGQLALEVVDIDSKPRWQEQFGTRIPVLEFKGREICQYTLDVDAVREILAELPGS